MDGSNVVRRRYIPRRAIDPANPSPVIQVENNWSNFFDSLSEDSSSVNSSSSESSSSSYFEFVSIPRTQNMEFPSGAESTTDSDSSESFGAEPSFNRKSDRTRSSPTEKVSKVAGITLEVFRSYSIPDLGSYNYNLPKFHSCDSISSVESDIGTCQIKRTPAMIFIDI